MACNQAGNMEKTVGVNSTEKHLYSLDGLRGLGACVVAFIWHYQHFQPQHGSPFYTLFPVSYAYGWLMVELFFMLSGFGMMMGYGRRIVTRSISFRVFMSRRLKRIYPVFLLSTVLVTVFQLLYRHKTGETFTYRNFDVCHLLLNLFLLQDGLLGTEWSFNAPSWCISISVLLYPLFYVICAGMKEERRILCAFSCLAAAGAGLVLSGWDGPFLNTLIGRGLVCFSIGVLLAAVYEKRDRFASKPIAWICLMILLGIYLLLRFHGERMAGCTQMVFILCFGPMMILCALLLPELEKLLSCKPFRMLGGISMEIYLFHFPIQCLIRVFDVYTGANLNYSAHTVWLLYGMLVLTASFSYKLFLKDRYEHWFCRLLCKADYSK